jgi:hypothetical protein
MIKKIQVNNQHTWSQHFMGWQPAIDEIKKLHHNQGVLFIGYLDKIAAFEKIKEPFIGFFHHTPENPDIYYKKPLVGKFKGLEYYFQTNIWNENKRFCKGIFTLSSHLAEFIKKKTGIKSQSLLHPFPQPETFFDFDDFLENPNKMLFHPGNWLRNFDIFNKIKSPFKKYITNKIFFKNPNRTVHSLGFIDKEKYNSILDQNIVFQCYYDMGASNTLGECIVKNTPIIINRLPATEEYLGKDYPLFFDTIDEAETILHNTEKIEEGYIYLKTLDKNKFLPQTFLENFYNSQIYQELKIPTLI